VTRPGSDWHPLVEDGRDPVPGDPQAIEELSGRLRATADTITATARALRRLSNLESWDSDAGREFAGKAGEVADDVSKAYSRYDTAASALTQYRSDLEGIQREAESLRRQAQDADADRRTAQQQLDAAPPPDPQVIGPSERDAHEVAVRNADARLGEARHKLEGLRGRHRDAGNAAAGRIETAMDADDLNDSFLDDLRDALKVISKICGIIATVCGILSLLVGWIPVIGQALAAVLGTIALIASAISLVCNILLWFNGDASWKDVAWDALSVASFGVGRIFGSAAKLSRLAARSKAWEAAKGLARVRNPGMNSAAIRNVTQQLMGGPRQGARAWETLGQAPSGILKLSSRGELWARTYGKLGDEMKQWNTFTKEAVKLGAGRTTLGGYLNQLGEAGKLQNVERAVFGHGSDGAAALALARQGTVQDLIAVHATAVGSFADSKQAAGLLGDLGSSDGFTGYFLGRSDLDVTADGGNG